MRALAGLTALREISVQQHAACATRAWRISAALTGLEKLSLSYTDVTDEGIEQLAALSKLTHLDLSGADVGDAGLADRGKLTRLEELHLNFGRFSDGGLKAIARPRAAQAARPGAHRR